MLSEQTADSIWNITKEKHVLSDTNISVVAKVIGLIFLGELPIKDFITALKNELGVDEQKAAAIAQDINIAIFQPVRNSLMIVHGISEQKTIPQNPNIKAQMPNQYQSPNYQNIKPTAPLPQAPTIKPPYQARPAHYYLAPRRNVIDLRTAKRKNSRRKYKGFFASY